MDAHRSARRSGRRRVFRTETAAGHRIRRELQRRDLEAIVSASGKIEPKKTVNISAQSPGRVTRLAVNEGDRVKAGQFLLQIDPVMAESAVRRDEAGVAAADTGLEQSIGASAQRPGESGARPPKHQAAARAVGGRPDDARDVRTTQNELDVREAELRASEQEGQDSRGATSSTAGGSDQHADTRWRSRGSRRPSTAS